MEEMSSHGHPNKRLKPPPPGLAPPPCRKGKAKMEEFAAEGDDGCADTASDADERTCGICLMEEGRSIRGAIDSCDHYFCFVCIMEWAKIESRCPLCKQRFGSIRRPPVRGVLFSERVVNVPVRDQVQQSFGNATGGGDPYADTTCSACHGSTDENLLLLCDLCDSAVHTYCVGLGFTVPEGDWYCHDCTILRNEQTKMLDVDHCSDENFSRVSRTMAEDCSLDSIFELIRDETSYSFSESQIKVIGRGTNDREPKDKATVQKNSKGNILHSDERPSRLAPAIESLSFLTEAKATELAARTLHQCRNLHLRIRILRDNWYALRSGSLDFRSSLVFPCDTSNNTRGIISTVSRQQDYQSSGCNEKVTGAGSQVSNEMNSCTSSRDVDKAWKMLEIAKSLQRAPTGAKSSHQSPNLPHKKSNGESKVHEQRELHHSSESSDHKSPACPTSTRILKDVGFESRLFGGAGLDKQFRHDSSEILREKCKLQNSGKRHDKLAKEEIGHCDEGPFLSSGWENLKRDREHCHENGACDSQHCIYHASGSGRLKDVSACSRPSNCDQVGTFRPAGKKEAPEDGGCNIYPSNVSSVLGKNMDESSSRICNRAKSEIQSLVKLNMKLQCKGHRLGTEEFKDVARVATHTVLAACGLDHSRSKARPFPSSICRHGDQANLRRSNLMPDSCRDCFYSFVKDVVESVISEKTSLSTKA